MIVLLAVGVIAIALILALMLTARRDVAHGWLFTVSILPLLITVVVPLPFSLTVSRAKLLAVTRAGILLSFVLSTAGLLLLLRAVMRRDRHAAILLGLETALAALPALVFVVSCAVFR